MSNKSAFQMLDDLGRRLEALEHAQSMLGVDEAVMMPSGGGEKRAEAMSMLAGMYHELATAPQIAPSVSLSPPNDMAFRIASSNDVDSKKHTNACGTVPWHDMSKS